MSTCKNRLFGHSPAHAGEGCDGCDAEHARLVEKHIGSGPYVDPFERGAAVAFGIMGMAEAIRQIRSIEGCDQCGKASNAWIGGTCMACWDAADDRFDPHG